MRISDWSSDVCSSDLLTLQVGEVHGVVVDDTEGADAGCSQIEQQRRAEAAGADQQQPGVQKLFLTFLADPGKYQVTRVAVGLSVTEFHEGSVRSFRRVHERGKLGRAKGREGGCPYGVIGVVTDRI